MSASGPQSLRGARVVLVNWRDPWHRRAGGSERYAWELARALRDDGAAVEFWTARDSGQTSRSVHEGIRVRRRGSTYPFYARTLLALLGARLRGGLPDLVVDMDCGIPAFSPVVVGRRTPVLLAVHHVHQDQFGLTLPAPLAALGRVLERRVMPRVYRRVPTLAVSESTVAEMRSRLGWRGEVRVVHNVTAPAESHLPTPDDPGDERVVVLGRVVAHKRVEDVVRAVALVLPRRPALVVDVIGTGTSISTVQAEIERLGIGGAVRLLGYVPEDDKYAAVAGARLHVCASDGEGWGLVVLEAAANGVPTLGRDVPGVRDSVREGTTGWLIDEPEPGHGTPLDERLAAGIVDALDRMADPVVRAEVVAACRAWAAEFGWQRMHREARDAAISAMVAPRSRH